MIDPTNGSPTRLATLQFLRYVVSGCVALAVHLAVLAVFVEIARTPTVLASTIGLVVAMVVNYGLQHRWVFTATGMHRIFFTRYVFITLATFLANLAIFALAYHGFKLWYPVAQVFATGIIFVLNFFLNKYYTFQVGDGRKGMSPKRLYP